MCSFGVNPYVRDGEIRPQETIIWCKAYFDILNSLGGVDSCDRRTDSLMAYAVLHYVASPKI